jgi:hypothetical protein
LLEARVVPATFTINTLSDLPDPNPGNGFLDDVDLATPGNQYSLRGAIQTANANNNLNETDQIVMAGGRQTRRRTRSSTMCTTIEAAVRLGTG